MFVVALVCVLGLGLSCMYCIACSWLVLYVMRAWLVVRGLRFDVWGLRFVVRGSL